MQRSSYILFRMRDTACGMWMTCIRSHAPMMRLKTGPTSGGEIRRCGRSGDFPRLLRFLFLTSNVSMGIHFTLNHSKPERRYPLRDGGCLAAHLRRHAGERGTADKAEALSRMRFYLSPFPVSPSPNKRMLIFFHNNSIMLE